MFHLHVLPSLSFFSRYSKALATAIAPKVSVKPHLLQFPHFFLQYPTEATEQCLTYVLPQTRTGHDHPTLGCTRCMGSYVVSDTAQIDNNSYCLRMTKIMRKVCISGVGGGLGLLLLFKQQSMVQDFINLPEFHAILLVIQLSLTHTKWTSKCSSKCTIWVQPNWDSNPQPLDHEQNVTRPRPSQCKAYECTAM